VSKPFVPSPQQEAIFQDVAEGEGHTVVLALSGTGKSSTILKSLEHLPSNAVNDTLLVAFNKNIAEHLKAQAPQGVTVQTLHSYGLRQISRAIYPRPTIDDEKMPRILADLIPEKFRPARAMTRSLVSLAKGCIASKPEAIDALIDAYDVNVPTDFFEREQFVQYAHQAMERSLEEQSTIDFDDMLYFPAKLKMTVQSYARVFCDELQDVNRAQVKLALGACNADGRFCSVGDKNQSLYLFRGAAHDAIDNVIQKLDARTLGLTVTYRCAKSIVRLAQTIVPEFEAAPWAPEGIVRDCNVSHLLAKADPGDFILSRTNAPLVKLFFQFIRDGKRVAIQGRDIGARLCNIVNRLAKRSGNNVGAMLLAVEVWKQKEVDRLAKLDRDASSIVDTAGCIEAVADGADSIDEVIGRIDRVFEDNGAGDKGKIILSSVHRSKGLERDRVWMLNETFLRGRKRKIKGEDGETYWKSEPPDFTERCIFYVCVTRAKRELVRVHSNEES
jgi:DNA helicase-2/ATP-dependent DNA helicase PcrA